MVCWTESHTVRIISLSLWLICSVTLNNKAAAGKSRTRFLYLSQWLAKWDFSKCCLGDQFHLQEFPFPTIIKSAGTLSFSLGHAAGQIISFLAFLPSSYVPSFRNVWRIRKQGQAFLPSVTQSKSETNSFPWNIWSSHLLFETYACYGYHNYCHLIFASFSCVQGCTEPWSEILPTWKGECSRKSRNVGEGRAHCRMPSRNLWCAQGIFLFLPI